MIYIIIIIALVVIIAFVRSLAEDNEEFSNQSVTEKFKPLINDLNNKVYGGGAETTILSKRSFNLYKKPSNEIIQFLYSSGGLTVKWSYKYFQKEMIKTKVLANARNISVFDQLAFSEKLISFMNGEKMKFQTSINPSEKLSFSSDANAARFNDGINLTNFTDDSVSERKVDSRINTNGAYVGVVVGMDEDGQKIDSTPVIIFLKDGERVFIVEEGKLEDVNNIQSNLIAAANSGDFPLYESRIGKYEFEGNKIYIEMNTQQDIDISFEGIIIEKNAILLTRFSREFNWEDKDLIKTEYFDKILFHFVECK